MKLVRIMKAKPNPAEKDRIAGTAPKKQLAAEWVEFKNAGDEPHSLEGISLHHVAYQSGCRDGKWEKVLGFKGILKPGEIVRIHSGGEIGLSEMYPEDAQGTDYHLFTGGNYIWNNTCGDTAALWNGLIWMDTASYDSYPPEGRILVRQGDKLVPGY